MELPDRSNYEATFSGRMTKLSDRQRDRLRGLMGDPPSMANVPASFWEQVERESTEELEVILLLIFLASATFHGGNREKLNPLAKLWAVDQARRLGGQMTRTSAKMAETLGRDLEDRAKSGGGGGAGGGGGGAGGAGGAGGDQDAATPPKAWLDKRLRAILGPARMRRLAVNETTLAQTEGGEAAVRETVGLSPDDTWRTNPQLSRTGPCPVCQPLNKLKRSTGWGGFTQGPPAHPLCVCDVVYANIPIIRPIRRR